MCVCGGGGCCLEPQLVNLLSAHLSVLFYRAVLSVGGGGGGGGTQRASTG